MGQAKSKVKTLNFRRAKFQFFKELVNRNPWNAALRNKGAEQNWQIFKDTFQSTRASDPTAQEVGKKGNWSG